MLSLRIGDVWAHTLPNSGGVGNKEMQHVYGTSGSGLHYIKWAMDLDPGYWHPNLHEGAEVEIFKGDIPLGSANITEVDRTNWTFVANGRYRRAERFYPYDTNSGSHIPSTLEQIEYANAHGLGWNGVGNLGGLPINWQGRAGDSIASVLTDYARTNSLRWGLTVDNTPFIEAEPYLYDRETTAQWAVRPGTPLMPTTDGSYVSRVTALYRGGGTYGVISTYDSAFSDAIVDPFVSPEGGHELRVIIAANVGGGEALEIANEIQRRHALRYTFTKGLAVTPGVLTTPGGATIENWAAGITCLGRMGVHYGAISTRNNAGIGETVQWVGGSATYREADDSLVFGSVDAEERNLASVLLPLQFHRPYPASPGTAYDRPSW